MHLPTIYALSTKPGRAAIGVIRVSGNQAQHIYHRLTKKEKNPADRRAQLRCLYSENGGLLDHALTTFFKGPNTYTGEDLLELHVHGGTSIVKSVLEAVKRLHDPKNGIHVRYAEQGEFSRRAFTNGKFDLTEIEGIRDMIDAETETQRVRALASLTGQNKSLVQEWRQEIVHNVALLTTVIDFGEEHDVEETESLFLHVEQNIDSLISSIEAYLGKVKRSDILLNGIKMTLMGPPNAGKSSLLNFLAGSDLAIVSDTPGTTRDIIDVPLDIEGYKVIAGDTAGIRDSLEKIEQEGIRRAKEKTILGDFVLAILPITQEVPDDIKAHMQILKEAKRPIIVALNKTDLVNGTEYRRYVQDFSSQLDLSPESFFPISCVSHDGTETLRKKLVHQFKEVSQTDSSDPVTLSPRARDLLENDVLYGLHQFKIYKDASDVVLASECLRQAVDGIGKITGESVGVEEILGVVFSSFCIGK